MDFSLIDPHAQKPNSQQTATQPKADFSAIDPHANSPKLVSTDSMTTAAPTTVKEGPADFTTMVKAATSSDPVNKVRKYAADRFPDLPMEQALQRYMFIDDTLHYADVMQNGEVVWVPELGEGFMQGAKGVGANLAGDSGTIGLMAGAGQLLKNAHPAARVIGTGVAGFGGDFIKRQLGQVLMGDADTSALADAQKSIPMGVMGAASELLPIGMTKYANRRAVQEMKAGLNKTDVLSQVKALEDDLAKHGFQTPLSAAEKAEVPSLLKLQRDLIDNPETADIIGKLIKDRGGAMEQDFFSLMKNISPEADAGVAGQRVAHAASDVMDGMKQARHNKTAPMYSKAWENAGEVDVSGVASKIDEMIQYEKGSIKATLEKAKKLLLDPDNPTIVGDDGVEQIVFDSNLRRLHGAKTEIDELISTAKRENRNGAAKLLSEVRDDLSATLEKTSPEYKAAQETFARESVDLNTSGKASIGRMADKVDERTGMILDDRVADILAPVINAKDPNMMRVVMQKISASDPNAWAAGVRGALQRSFEKIKGSLQGDHMRPAKWANEILGSPMSEATWKVALEPVDGAFEQLKALADVFRRTGLATHPGSPTAGRMAGQVSLAEQANKGLPAAGQNAIKSLQVWDIPGRVAGFWENWQTKNYAQKLANLLTDPNGVAKLKELQLSSGISRKGTAAFNGFFGGLESLLENDSNVTEAPGVKSTSSFNFKKEDGGYRRR